LEKGVLTDRHSGIWYVVLSGLMFGLIGYFGMSIVYAHLSVNTMVLWRFLVASIFMFSVVLIQCKARLIVSWPSLEAFFAGALLYGPSSTLYFLAAARIGSGLAMVLFFTYPAIVLCLNRFFYKHEISQSFYWAIAIIFVGMLFLTHGESTEFGLSGIGLSLLSALLFALYMVFSQHSKASAQVDTLMVCIGSALSAGIAASIEHTLAIPYGFKVWMDIIGVSIICTSIPILLLLKGLKHIGSLEASILSVLEPVFVLLVGIWLLGETVNVMQVLGVIILLSGALLSLVTSS
jgi:drug/metabolite transporter (DMT)-like permease